MSTLLEYFSPNLVKMQALPDCGALCGYQLLRTATLTSAVTGTQVLMPQVDRIAPPTSTLVNTGTGFPTCVALVLPDYHFSVPVRLLNIKGPASSNLLQRAPLA